MAFEQLPLEILLKIFSNIENISTYKYIITEIICKIENYYDNYFNKFIDNWKQNKKYLLLILAKNNNLESLNYLFNNYQFSNIEIQNLANYSAYIDNMDILKYICNKYYVNLYEITESVIKSGNINNILYIMKRFNICIDNIISLSSKYNNTKILEYFINNNYNINYSLIAPYAAFNGNRNLIEFALSKCEKVIPEISEYAALSGFYDIVLDYEIGNYNNISLNAIIGNNLKIFEWALRNGAYNYKEIAELAAKLNNLDICKKIYKLMRSSVDYIAYGASIGGNYELFLWAIRRGADEYNFYALNAVLSNSIKILDYCLYKNENNINEIRNLATLLGNKNILNYLDKRYYFYTFIKTNLTLIRKQFI